MGSAHEQLEVIHFFRKPRSGFARPKVDQMCSLSAPLQAGGCENRVA